MTQKHQNKQKTSKNTSTLLQTKHNKQNTIYIIYIYIKQPRKFGQKKKKNKRTKKNKTKNKLPFKTPPSSNPLGSSCSKPPFVASKPPFVSSTPPFVSFKPPFVSSKPPFASFKPPGSSFSKPTSSSSVKPPTQPRSSSKTACSCYSKPACSCSFKKKKKTTTKKKKNKQKKKRKHNFYILVGVIVGIIIDMVGIVSWLNKKKKEVHEFVSKKLTHFCFNSLLFYQTLTLKT